MLKKILFIALMSVSLMGTTALAAKHNHTRASVKTLDKVIAVVNDQVITQRQLDDLMVSTKHNMRQANVQIPPDAQLRKELLQQLIYRSMQLQIAKKMKIEVTDQEVQKTIENIRKRNKMTLSQMKQKLIANGTTYVKFKKELHEQMVIQKVQRQMVGGQVGVSQADVEAFKKQHGLEALQYHVVDYLLPIANGKKADADRVYKALQKNPKKSFPKNWQRNDLGWNTADNLPDIFANAIKTMRVGSFHAPIRAENGYHIIQLKGQKKGKSKLTDQQIHQLLFRQKLNKRLKAWLDNLAKTAYIKIVDEQ